MKKAIYSCWSLIQENVGDCKTWPKNIRKLFWSQSPSHWERLLLGAFVVVNGLDPNIMSDWIKLMNWTKKKCEHIMSLINNYLLNRNYKLYAFNVGMKKYVHLDMTTHYYNGYCSHCDNATLYKFCT